MSETGLKFGEKVGRDLYDTPFVESADDFLEFFRAEQDSYRNENISSGPSTDPCGTPPQIVYPEHVPFAITSKSVFGCQEGQCPGVPESLIVIHI